SADPRMTAADAQRLKALYGLDKPLHERYLVWAGRALQGEFGYSRIQAKPVLDVILPRLGNTIALMLSALLIALLIAVPLGVLAALRARGWVERAITLACFAGVSMPTFWFGLMLIVLFAVTLQWLPAGGVDAVAEGSLGERIRHLVLPVSTLVIVIIPI